jgi:hypothetical protein
MGKIIGAVASGIFLLIMAVFIGRWTAPGCPSCEACPECPIKTGETFYKEKFVETKTKVAKQEGVKSVKSGELKTCQKTKIKASDDLKTCQGAKTKASDELKTCQEAKTTTSDELKTCQEEGKTLLSAFEGLREKTGVQCVLHTGEGFPETPRGVYYKPTGIFKGVSSIVVCWRNRSGKRSNATASSSSTSTYTPSNNGRLGKLENKVAKLDTRVGKVETKAADNSLKIDDNSAQIEKEEEQIRGINLIIQKHIKGLKIDTKNP